MTNPTASSRQTSSGDRWLWLSLTSGLLFLAVQVTVPWTARLRAVLLGAALLGAFVACLAAVSRNRTANGGRTAVIIFLLSCLGMQESVIDSPKYALPYLVAGMLVFAASGQREVLVLGLQRFWTMGSLALLAPAVLGRGFLPGRVWLPGVPGRYYSAFSHPNALGFMAGLGVLIAWPSRGRRGTRTLLGASGLLLALSASYTSLIALAVAIAAYLLIRIRGPLASDVLLRLTAPALVLFAFILGTDKGLQWMESLSQHVSATNRTHLWVNLLSYVHSLKGGRWFGLGQVKTALLAGDFNGVASAHSTLLQLALSLGLVGTTLFLAALHLVLSRDSESSTASLVVERAQTTAILVFVLVTSLTSVEPASPIVLAFLWILVSCPRRASDLHSGEATEMARRTSAR
jgi:hypothetical protein